MERIILGEKRHFRNKMERISRKDRVLLEELIEKYGQEELLEKLNRKSILPYAVAAGLSIGGIAGLNYLSNNQEVQEIKPSNPYGMSEEDYKLFKKKVDAAKDVMSDVLGKNGKSLDDIMFDIENVMYLCYKYNFDEPLLLSQSQNESHFGTAPRARRTGSVISIGQWDNKTVTTYPDQDSCFEPYIKIMQRDYLQNGKVSVDDLLKAGNFVNYLGMRFASNPHYERNVRVTRNKIIREHPELSQSYSTYNMNS